MTLFRQPPRSTGGWLLVGLLVLLTIMGIAFTGIVRMLVEHIRTTGIRTGDTRAYYLAQAGVMAAFYDFRDGSDGGMHAFDPGADVIVDGSSGKDDTYRLAATQGDGLFVNMKSATLPAPNNVPGCGGTQRDRLTNWRVRNVIGVAPNAVISQLALNWGQASPGAVARVEINGSKVWPTSGNCSSAGQGEWMNIADVSVPPGGIVANTNTLYFSDAGTFRNAGTGQLTKPFLELRFLMADGTTRDARYYTAVGDSDAGFTVTAIGKAQRGPLPFSVCRRLQAAYTACVGAATPADCNTAGKEEGQFSAGKESEILEVPGGC